MIQEAFYKNAVEQTKIRIAWLSKRSALFSTLRLLCIAAIGGGLYLLWGSSLILLVLVCGLALFIVLVNYHAETSDVLRFSKNRLRLLEEETAMSASSWRDRPAGAKHQEPGHPFTADLNYFGAKGIFAYINRCQSEWADDLLASWLKNPFYDRDALIAEQNRLKLLATAPDFLFDYLADMAIAPLSLHAKKALENWQDHPLELPNRFADIILGWVLPAIALAGAILFGFSLINFSQFLLSLLPCGIAIMFRLKGHQRAFAEMEPIGKIAQRFSSLAGRIQSSDLAGNPAFKFFTDTELANAKIAFYKLQRIQSQIDNRNNFFVSTVLNILLFWDYRAYRKLAKWRTLHEAECYRWVENCIEIEALISLGVYTFNHPDYVFARFDLEAGIDLVNGRHILMDQAAVANSIALGESPGMAIITGANMAGKSTFLRMVATHITLSLRGLPVSAESIRVAPSLVFTSMSTSDSLADDESYFFNEIKRLAELLKLTDQGLPVFAVLDEILKGTNSVDKAKGSAAFVEKLLSKRIVGLVATHDLSLCELTAAHPKELMNYRFEIEFKDSELAFSYRIEPGVCANMNATFLLQKHGLIE